MSRDDGCQARYAAVLQERVPRPLWRAYVEAREAPVQSFTASYQEALETAGSHTATGGDEKVRETGTTTAPRKSKGPLGFQP